MIFNYLQVREDTSLSQWPPLVLYCFRVTAHCCKFFNSHLSAEYETACQTKNVVTTVWQCAISSLESWFSYLWFSVAFVKTGREHRVEMRLLHIIVATTQVNDDRVSTKISLPTPEEMESSVSMAFVDDSMEMKNMKNYTRT